MRSKIALSLAALAAAAAVLPLASASASCQPDPVNGGCADYCAGVGRAYDNLRDRSGGVLPRHTFNCID